MRKQQAPRPTPTPTQVPHSASHMEFEKFATFSEGVILDEIDRHRKEEKEKQKEIDDLYKKLLEKEKDAKALKEREKDVEVSQEQEDEKKIVKIKSHLSKPDVTAVGLQRLKTSGSSKKLLSKPSRTVSQSRLPRWL